MLTVYLDFKSPAAYLALKPTLALAERLSIDIDWQPFRTVERDIPKLGKDETVGESHRRVRAASQRALNQKYARHQGLNLTYPAIIGSTDLALGVLSEIDGDKLPFVTASFEAYWREHADLDNAKVVRALLEASGYDHNHDLSNAWEALDRAQVSAEEAGIVDAPAYVIEEQIFVGREHLPWIEEIARRNA